MAKTLAERKFNEKLNRELRVLRNRPVPPGVQFTSKEDRKAYEDAGRRAFPLATDRVELLFKQYGTYLELVGPDAPSGEAKVYEVPRV